MEESEGQPHSAQPHSEQPHSGSRESVDSPPLPLRTLHGEAADTLGEMADAIAATDRVIACAMGIRAVQIDQLRRWGEITVRAAAAESQSAWSQRDTARRTIVSELAAVMRIPEPTAQRLVAESQVLVEELPATLAALRAGEIGYRHAQTMSDHAMSLPADSRAAFEAAMLPYARNLTVAKFERKARTAREYARPDTIRERHLKSAADRSFTFEPTRDGMAYLQHYLPATEARDLQLRFRGGVRPTGAGRAPHAYPASRGFGARLPAARCDEYRSDESRRGGA